ncbi:MAG: hypothetical protein AAB250_08660, partial [Bdellovibrionota bacterium]
SNRFEVVGGAIAAGSQSASGGEVRFYEMGGSGNNFVSLRAPSSIAADTTWLLPASEGTLGQVLRTDGAGSLSWVTASSNIGDFLKDGSVTMTGSLKMGGQTIYGSGNSAGTLTLESTSHATKGLVQVTGNLAVSGRMVSSVVTDADALSALTVDFASANMIRATGATAACGTLNITNTNSGGSFTVTILNANATCSTIQWNGSTSNVKLPSGYAGGVAVTGVVYTFIDDGATLWVSSVPF